MEQEVTVGTAASFPIDAKAGYVSKTEAKQTTSLRALQVHIMMIVFQAYFIDRGRVVSAQIECISSVRIEGGHDQRRSAATALIAVTFNIRLRWSEIKQEEELVWIRQ